MHLWKWFRLPGNKKKYIQYGKKNQRISCRYAGKAVIIKKYFQAFFDHFRIKKLKLKRKSMKFYLKISTAFFPFIKIQICCINNALDGFGSKKECNHVIVEFHAKNFLLLFTAFISYIKVHQVYCLLALLMEKFCEIARKNGIFLIYFNQEEIPHQNALEGFQLDWIVCLL